jgi:hypothetical protein
MQKKPEKSKKDGLWFKRVATVKTKKQAQPLKRKLMKEYNVRVECDYKSPKTGKVFYGIYVRKKR